MAWKSEGGKQYDLAEVGGILTALSRVLMKGLPDAFRRDVFRSLGLKDVPQNEFALFTTLMNVCEERGSLDIVHEMTESIRAHGVFRDVESEFESLARSVAAYRALMSKKKYVFVLMPFTDSHFVVYETIIKPTVTALGCVVEHVGETVGPDIIIQTVCDNIRRADFLIADATGRNPNVFYEMGYAHALGKPVIIVTQNKADIPFDVAGIRYLQYQEDTPKAFTRDLDKFARALL